MIGDGRQPPAARESRLGQELPGAGAIEAGRGDARVVARQRGRQDALARDHASLEEPLHDRGRIDGVRDDQAHPAIVERGLLDVEAHPVGAQGRPDRHLCAERGIGLHGPAVAGRDVADVEVAGLVVVEAGDLGRDDAEHHPLQVGRAPEVVGEGLEHHAVVAPPLLQAKRAGPHGAAREGRAQTLGLLARHDGRRVVGHQVEERGEGLLERQLDGALIHHAHARDLPRPALDEGGRPRDLLEHPGPLAARGALEGELHVGRPHDPAAVELHAGAEHEGVDAMVGRHRPALGQARPRLQSLVQLHQRVEELPHDRRRGGIRGLGGVERRGVGDEDAPQRARRPAVLGTHRPGRQEQAQQRQEAEAIHRPGPGTGAAAGGGASIQTRSKRGLPLGCRRRLRTSMRVAAQCSRT